MSRFGTVKSILLWPAVKAIVITTSTLYGARVVVSACVGSGPVVNRVLTLEQREFREGPKEGPVAGFGSEFQHDLHLLWQAEMMASDGGSA